LEDVLFDKGAAIRDAFGFGQLASIGDCGGTKINAYY
jgi:hypothetical protein